MTEIRGIIPPIITPMDEEEAVNEKELANQVNRLIESGVHGIFALGTNGEGYILSEEEKERVLSVVIETAAERVPVYAGTGCVSTKDTIRMSKKAQAFMPQIIFGKLTGTGSTGVSHNFLIQSIIYTSGSFQLLIKRKHLPVIQILCGKNNIIIRNLCPLARHSFHISRQCAGRNEQDYT